MQKTKMIRYYYNNDKGVIRREIFDQYGKPVWQPLQSNHTPSSVKRLENEIYTVVITDILKICTPIEVYYRSETDSVVAITHVHCIDIQPTKILISNLTHIPNSWSTNTITYDQYTPKALLETIKNT